MRSPDFCPARLRRLLLALLLPWVLASCKGPVERAEALAQRQDPKQLRHDAAVFYKNYQGTRVPGYASVARADWPKSVQAFEPVRVHVYRDGVALALTSSAEPESGIYIIPEGLELEPRSDGRTRYRRLNHGIYRYDFGRNLR